MQIFINNSDGNGDVDFSSAVETDKVFLVRRLNKPSSLSLRLILDEGFTVPAANARIILKDEIGRILFGGNTYGQPTFEFIGCGTDGTHFRIALSAFSDDVVLDAKPFQMTTGVAGTPAQQAWKAILSQSATPQLQPAVSDQIPNCGYFIIQVGTKWSEAAGALASSTRSAYRFVDRQLQVAPIAQVSHSISLDEPGLKLHSTQQADPRWLASDVILIGGIEPQAYVYEIFEGNGSTSTFQLSRAAFRRRQSESDHITDLFQGTMLNRSIWSVSDPGSYISLTSGGLTCTGGPGRSDASVVASDMQVELGGTVLLESRGVCIKPGSFGQILGLYVSNVEIEKCFAAFDISSSAAGLFVQPMLNGLLCGSSIYLENGHSYTFRIRLNSPDMQRVYQTYVYRSTPESGMYGGNTSAGVGTIFFDVLDSTSGTLSNTVNLFSGSLGSIPASCILGLLNNTNLTCSMRAVQYVQSGPLDIYISSNGNSSEQQVGNVLEGAKCRLNSADQIIFNSDSIPMSGALVCATYRTAGRSVARRQVTNVEPVSGQASLWMGSIARPIARSTNDCDNAALAMLQISSSEWSMMKGTYTASRFAGDIDIWPGDAVQIGPMPDGAYVTSVIREVQLNTTPGAPERTECTVQFAGDWAEELSMALSEAVPNDVVLPSSANFVSSSLESLSRLKVINVSSDVVEIVAGVEAPTNGGFEVRRRDHTFGPEINSDLVFRTSASSFTITRLAAVEEYFIRMYDHNVPPNYSLFSAAVLINVPR